MTGKTSLLLIAAIPLLLLLVAVGLPVICLLQQITGVPLSASLDLLRDRTYLLPLRATVEIAVAVTAVTTLVSAPVALFLSLLTGIAGRLMLLGVVTSLWLSVLVRSYSWIELLGHQGPVNAVLAIAGGNVDLLFTQSGVIVGMTHILLPYIILFTWSRVRSDAKSYLEVALVHNATRRSYLFRVALPHLTPSLLQGAALVFVLSLGFFITPSLLGGGKGDTLVLGVMIEEQANVLGQWWKASILSIELAVVVFIGAALSLLGMRIFHHWRRQ